VCAGVWESACVRMVNPVYFERLVCPAQYVRLCVDFPHLNAVCVCMCVCVCVLFTEGVSVA